MQEVTYDFSRKNFVVIGASSGIGRQIAKELAQSGALVLAIARRGTLLRNLKEEVGKGIVFAALDIAEKEKLETEIERFVCENGKISGCVYTAGMADVTPLRFFSQMQAEKMMKVHFWCAIHCIQLLTKKKYAHDGSSYLLFSSVYASKGEKGMFAYGAAKAALQGAVAPLAKEICKKKHRINTISPGWIKTEMTAGAWEVDERSNILSAHLLGTGNVTDISGIVLFLLSDRARWITGTDIVVDGGYLV